MFRLSHIIVMVIMGASMIQAEYIWTGEAWIWQDKSESSPSQTGSSSSSFGGVDSGVVEGSGSDPGAWDDDDDYDEDDYDEYTYEDDYDEPIKPKKDKKKNQWDDYGSFRKKDKKKNKNKFNTGILPADDEDFVEGSGSDGFDIPRSNYPESNNNNNNNYNYNFNNPVDIDDNSQNVYVDKDDDTYDDDYDYDDEYDEEDDITYGMPEDNFGGANNNFAVNPTTAKPKDTIYNINNNNNVWENPSVPTTTRSHIPRTTTLAPAPTRPDADRGPEVHRTPGSRPVSFFAQPGILAAVIGGAVVGLLCAILLVMFIVYRMRKKDEGSYALDEPKRSHNVNSYSKPPSREFYA